MTFYIHKHTPDKAMPTEEYVRAAFPLGYIELAGTYLEEAINANAGDGLIWWLSTDTGEAWALENARHHWFHGDVLFSDCPNLDCRKSWAGWQIIMPAAIDRYLRESEGAA